MNFSSFNYFLFFLPVVLIACAFARRLRISRGVQVCILIASLVFYGYSRPFNLIWLGLSILVNWYVAVRISRASGTPRKRLLQAGLFFNIAFLGTFKYLYFVLDNIASLFHLNIHAPHLSFPLGISFFTIAQIMYLVDCYEELLEPATLFDHATFVSFFPYVISGPIPRARRMFKQFSALDTAPPPSADTIARATSLFFIGVVKKVVLADAFAFSADFAFDGRVAHLSMLEAWVLISAYAFQLYFDFSGYSDMAVASGMFLGIEVPRNFDSPLRSKSIIEFWQKWHITLSQFITTYLYTPILRSFKTVSLHTAALATILAMAIAGLWHGPAWTFVVFGTIHGLGLAANQYWRKKKMPVIPNWASWLLTMLLLDLGFVFFRSPDFRTALLYSSRLVSWHNPLGIDTFLAMRGAGLMAGLYIAAQIVGVAIVFLGQSSDRLTQEFKPTWKTCFATAACVLLSLLYLNSNLTKPFIYFAF